MFGNDNERQMVLPEKYQFEINRLKCFNRFLNFSSHFNAATLLVSWRKINFYVLHYTN